MPTPSAWPEEVGARGMAPEPINRKRKPLWGRREPRQEAPVPSISLKRDHTYIRTSMRLKSTRQDSDRTDRGLTSTFLQRSRPQDNDQSDDPLSSTRRVNNAKKGKHYITARQEDKSPPASADEEYGSNAEEEDQLMISPPKKMPVIKLTTIKILSLKRTSASSGSQSSSVFRSSNLSRTFSHGSSIVENSSDTLPSSIKLSPPFSKAHTARNQDFIPIAQSSKMPRTVPRQYQRPKHRKQSHSSDSGNDKSTDDDSDQPQQTLFAGTKRRQKVWSSEGHIEMLKACRGLIAARVLSGDGTRRGNKGRRSDAWCNANDEYAQSLILQVWAEVRNDRRKYRIPTELKVMQDPLPAEARDLRDYIGDYRSKVMQRAREEVQQYFPVDDYAATREKVQLLLDQDRFMCGTGTQEGTEPDVKDRWMSKSIVKLIARVFWIKAESGLARVAATSVHFDPLRGETIYYIVSCLCWGLREYDSGARRTHRSDSGLEECYHRFREMWSQQNPVKRDMICEILTARVLDYVRRLDGESTDHEAEEDPHKDDLSTLEAYRQFLPARLKDKLREESTLSPETKALTPDSLFGGEDTYAARVSEKEKAMKNCAEETKTDSSEPNHSEDVLQLHWSDRDGHVCEIELGMHITFESIVETLKNGGDQGVIDMEAADSFMFWFWTVEGDESNATMVSDNEGLKKLLYRLREEGFPKFYGRAHGEEDEVSS